jgi:hypothetical protein
LFRDRQQKSNAALQTRGSEEFNLHIDKALDVFGTSVKSVVYFRFFQEHNLRREDVASNPEAFISTIKEFFGSGASKVESEIVRELRAALGSIDLSRSDTISLLKTARYHFARSK